MNETSMIRSGRPLTCRSHNEWPQPSKYSRYTLELTDITEQQKTTDALAIVKQRPDIDSLKIQVSLFEEEWFSAALTDLLSTTDRTWSVDLIIDPSMVSRLVQKPEFIVGLRSIRAAKHLTLRSAIPRKDISRIMPLIRSLPVFQQLETFDVSDFDVNPECMDELFSFPFADHISGVYSADLASYLFDGSVVSNATLDHIKTILWDVRLYEQQESVSLSVATLQLPMLQKFHLVIPPFSLRKHVKALAILFDWMNGDQCRLADLAISMGAIVDLPAVRRLHDAVFEIRTLKTLELLCFDSITLGILHDKMQKRNGNIHFDHLKLNDCDVAIVTARKLMMSFPIRVTLSRTICWRQEEYPRHFLLVILFEIMWGFQSSTMYSIGPSLWAPLLQNIGRFVKYISRPEYDPKGLALDAIFTVLRGLFSEPLSTWR